MFAFAATVDWLESAKRCRGLPHPNCWQGPYQQKRVGQARTKALRARFEGSTYLAQTFNRILEEVIVTRLSSKFTAIVFNLIRANQKCN